jgi:hypothetical protein
MNTNSQALTALVAVTGLLVFVATTSAFDDDGTKDENPSTTVREDGIDDLARKYGGNEESQKAVKLALEWLAEHQNPDGSWGFDHRGGRCGGRCGDPGSLAGARNAATGMALLPLLAAQQTHVRGEQKLIVARGLKYLVKQMRPDGSLRETGGSMYSHGIAAIALCEAYAVTKDPRLAVPAKAALKHIEFAQDPVGGGWRYTPRTPGDTSVTGWQFSALQTARSAGLPVGDPAWKKAADFFASVQSDDGAKYGYLRPGAGTATTAIGLLSRTYLGGKHGDDALDRGVDFLSNLGPSKTNMYYNYYASQVLFQHGGAEWEMWNPRLRDLLVESQAREGHEKGSWFFFGDPGASAGGRHYATCLAALNLEVYYRHPRILEEAKRD